MIYIHVSVKYGENEQARQGVNFRIKENVQ
jgi:hypothetical protein